MTALTLRTPSLMGRTAFEQIFDQVFGDQRNMIKQSTSVKMKMKIKLVKWPSLAVPRRILRLRSKKIKSQSAIRQNHGREKAANQEGLRRDLLKEPLLIITTNSTFIIHQRHLKTDCYRSCSLQLRRRKQNNQKSHKFRPYRGYFLIYFLFQPILVNFY